MARLNDVWLPSLTLFALSACGGSQNEFFSTIAAAGTGSSNQAGASSSAGSTSNGPGSAGRSSAGSAGTGATGGSSSGGAPSVGGSLGGDAGANSSGGVAGSRAGADAGGAAGHAGALGGTAGAAGSHSEPTCNELQRLANQQLEAARVCNQEADAPQCTGEVKDLCDCEVPVQRSESPETRAYLRTLKQLQSKNCSWACLAIVCASFSNAQCKGSGSSTRGTCVAGNGRTR